MVAAGARRPPEVSETLSTPPAGGRPSSSCSELCCFLLQGHFFASALVAALPLDAALVFLPPPVPPALPTPPLHIEERALGFPLSECFQPLTEAAAAAPPPLSPPRAPLPPGSNSCHRILRRVRFGSSHWRLRCHLLCLCRLHSPAGRRTEVLEKWHGFLRCLEYWPTMTQLRRNLLSLLRLELIRQTYFPPLPFLRFLVGLLLLSLPLVLFAPPLLLQGTREKKSHPSDIEFSCYRGQPPCEGR